MTPAVLAQPTREETRFHPAVTEWFRRALGTPTACQREAWRAIASGRSTLIAAPTGSGKTLAAFLSALNDLVCEGLGGPLPASTRVLYVSPLKALSNDIQRNLESPLMGIADCLNEQGRAAVAIRTMVRTGDTPQAAREAMRRAPPHILVTTPESLYILLTSDSGRRMLADVRTVIVDEIHAIAGNKRGAHLSLSLERLEALTAAAPVRIGLSATQRPIDRVARFLMGARHLTSGGAPDCHVIDIGHDRPRDLALEIPDSPLDAIMSGEVWQEVYGRIEALIEAHSTTLVFVNTRRLAERVAHALSERLGDAHVTSHHGSLAREQRLDAEQRLKRGELKALVATASLELGIDIGHVDLVCQLGSPHSIATFLQRVGRSGHAVGGTPKGRLFPLSRDDLVECTALLEAVARGELDQLVIPQAPLDVLAQQIVAMAAAEPWSERALLERVRGAHAYRALARERFTACLRMLADGFATRRGRRGAYIFRDAVNGEVRARRGARLVAITNGGAIPDNADFNVVVEPEGLFIGTLNEDFAIESMPGDIFLLGNTPWRILRVEEGTVRVEDARGLPPTIPFWFGEAPGRTEELSAAVSALRARVADVLDDPGHPTPAIARRAAVDALRAQSGIDHAEAEQLVDHLAAGFAAFGALPSADTVLIERFFDDSGGMQLVIHSTFGSRINRAWGLALRKRFCRAFNFELQAAANEDAIVLSLGETHSFPLADAARFVRSRSARDVLTQALLDAPVFDVRWRWNANIALAVPRFRGGKKVPPQIQRMQAEDLVAVAFPDQIACLENLSGPRRIPDHPLVEQTIHDALSEAMDIAGLERLLGRIEAGEVRIVARDLTQPSPLAAEILVASPYAFLDDAPAEERRTRAVRSRRHPAPEEAAELGRIDPSAVAQVADSLKPRIADAHELHDALVLGGCLRADEMQALTGSRGRGWLATLAASRRAAEVELGARGAPGAVFLVAAERLQQFTALHPTARARTPLETPAELRREHLSRDAALVELVRARIQITGPFTLQAMAHALATHPVDVATALAALEAEGLVLRGRFSASAGEQWCERRALARIHRASVRRAREAVRPVTRSVFMGFLLDWQHLSPDTQLSGAGGLARVLERLEGAPAPAQSWESEILPARLTDFDPAALDALCLRGKAAWIRTTGEAETGPREGARGAATLRRTPVALVARSNLALWSRGARPQARAGSLAARLLECLERDGASFLEQLVERVGEPAAALERALAELAATGAVTCDGFAGLRALIRRRRRIRAARHPGAMPSPFADAGRWSRRDPVAWPADAHRARLKELEFAERHARILLARYGVVFKALLAREPAVAPWRDLLKILRRLEARGEVHGGRFVDGFSGEQFALPEAVEALDIRRRRVPQNRLVCISGADPINLTGIVTPGLRVAARAGTRVVFRDGVPVAARSGARLTLLDELEPQLEWSVRALAFASTAGGTGDILMDTSRSHAGSPPAH